MERIDHPAERAQIKRIYKQKRERGRLKGPQSIK